MSCLVKGDEAFTSYSVLSVLGFGGLDDNGNGFCLTRAWQVLAGVPQSPLKVPFFIHSFIHTLMGECPIGELMFMFSASRY